jgi:hypothetical protein
MAAIIVAVDIIIAAAGIMDIDMVLLSQITNNPVSPAILVAIVAAGCLVLFVVVKIGGVILKLLLGLAGIAIVWWFVAKMIH